MTNENHWQKIESMKISTQKRTLSLFADQIAHSQLFMCFENFTFSKRYQFFGHFESNRIACRNYTLKLKRMWKFNNFQFIHCANVCGNITLLTIDTSHVVLLSVQQHFSHRRMIVSFYFAIAKKKKTNKRKPIKLFALSNIA